MAEDQLLKKIGRFLKRTNMAESTFGNKAANDGKLLSRLRAGGEMLPSTKERLIKFMRDFDVGGFEPRRKRQPASSSFSRSDSFAE